MKKVETVCLANDNVQAKIKALELPVGSTVVVEPWTYATDGMNDMSKRVSMVVADLLYPERYADMTTVLVLSSSGRKRRCQLLRISVGYLCRSFRGSDSH